MTTEAGTFRAQLARKKSGILPSFWGTRTCQVLYLVSLGLTQKEISAHLGISRRTVAYYIEHGRNIFGADTTIQAVMMAERAGFFKAPEITPITQAVDDGLKQFTFDLQGRKVVLTGQHLALMKHLADGLTLVEVANRMKFSLRWVNLRTAEIRAALRTASTREAVALVVGLGWLTVDKD